MRWRLYLAIAPAGSRRKGDYWKSGFYQIAMAADVPVLCGVVDYQRKETGIIGIVHLTGDERVDMDKIRAIYEGYVGKHPERMGRIRLRAEDKAEDKAEAEAEAEAETEAEAEEEEEAEAEAETEAEAVSAPQAVGDGR